MRATASLLALVLTAALAASGCGKTVDLATGVQVLDVSTGWFDAGIVDGKNKLVPSVTFTLKNTSDQKLRVLQVNALFRRVTEADEWGSGLVTAAGSDGLAAGATTAVLTVRSPLGYTGTDPRDQMLQNKQFVDAKVDLFAKYGNTQWKKIGEYPITRRLITP